MSSYGCQQVLLTLSADTRAILEFICTESNKLANCGIYLARQLYFKTGRIPNKAKLHRLLKFNPHFQALYSHVAQQTLTAVAESFSSFLSLMKAWRNGKIPDEPKLPNYKKKSLKLVSYPHADVQLRNGQLRFPLGKKVKAWFGIDAFYLPMPTNLKFEDIREFRILPRNKEFYLELIYRTEPVQVDVDFNRALGIDHGIDNWLTCVSNVGTSFILDGRHLKSLNRWYNKRVATIKKGKPQGFWCKLLGNITEKRNRQVRDAVNKAARLVINHCIENKIGTVVFGWNPRQKDGIDLGTKNNQQFVQIPTGKLKERIKQLCDQYGLRFVETEESYTSQASFVDGDSLPTFGEKPEGWKASGRRVTRGLYRTAKGWFINADCNGAANILRKVAATLGLDLGGVGRGGLYTPLRVPLWTCSRIPALGT
jgi:IS605 OrfB family transposase